MLYTWRCNNPESKPILRAQSSRSWNNEKIRHRDCEWSSFIVTILQMRKLRSQMVKSLGWSQRLRHLRQSQFRSTEHLWSVHSGRTRCRNSTAKREVCLAVMAWPKLLVFWSGHTPGGHIELYMWICCQARQHGWKDWKYGCSLIGRGIGRRAVGSEWNSLG